MVTVLSNTRICCRGRNVYDHFHIFKRLSSLKVPQPVFLETSLEEPVIVIKEQDDVDIIGPPDPISNLRPIIRKRLISETALQTRLRNLQDATQEWNHKFWTEHNKKFKKEQQSYIDSYLRGFEKRQLTADEMSEFYKKFLDENLSEHIKYNGKWIHFQVVMTDNEDLIEMIKSNTRTMNDSGEPSMCLHYQKNEMFCFNRT
ncbi:hypothetical protein JTB14_034636 [Gonioctena quinquepunctata]|nr:hypothetical protein JTB14_034636 [Gonioctena quinquepunctata]